MGFDLVSTIDQYDLRARRRSQKALVALLAVSVFTSALLVRYPPGWIAFLLCAGVAFVIAAWYRPAIGMGLVLGATILFEQFDFARFTPVTRMVPFFENASTITGLSGFEASPLELLLVTLTVVMTARLVMRRQPVYHNGVAGPVVVFVLAMAVWLVRGLLSGGELTVALWELRGLAYFSLLVLLVPQMLSSSRDVALLLWVAVVLVILKAAQGAWNYFAVLDGDLGGVRSVTGHEDALFIGWMIVLLVALSMYRSDSRQRTALLVSSPVLAFTFVATDRRAAYVALAIGLVVLAALVATERSMRAVLVRVGVPAVLALSLVLVAGWNSSGPLGIPAGVVKSIASPQSREDADSSYFRRVEEVNLIHAIESNPVVGLGFGRPFQTPGQGGIVDVGFSLQNVIPHNEIMWIWAKMGTVGFGLFWVMMGGVIVFGGLAVRTVREPFLRAVAATVTCAVVMQLVVSYVDLQLTYARNMVFLGVLVGALSRLPAFEGGGSES